MIPQLSDALIDKLGALIVHADHLVDEIYFGQSFPSNRLERALRQVRDDLADHEILALKLALDRDGRLPKP
jgi:hypothetical protein